ncbi:hypothetical protein RHGRI_028263 [Rhododendron griersonianum]|uniref:PGG domain-containing protein n=1 Tax=Rhododendron griersonianum TaxID=479676 RepID=A0AAV6IF50_9ERIC|nr:hypothetical protein RHGRI_028263 [Rhododendron griersonianum]
MNLKPSLSRKLNPDGLSPMHLALLNRHSETAKALIKLDKDLVRVKGRERLTPLQYTAETDDRVDILAEFLCACPESIGDLNVRGETALHMAVKNCNARALGVLMGWIRKTGKHWVKNIKDGRGNTILHTAVSTSQPHVWMSMEMRNAVLVVAVLITTATFQTVLSPPGGGSGLSDSNSLFASGSHINATIFTSTDNSSLFANGSHINATIFTSMHNISLFANGSHINATVFTSMDDAPNIFLPVFYAMNTVAFISSIAMINILILPLKVFAPLHASLMFLTMGYGIAFLIIPSMYYLEFIFAFSAIAIASLLYGVHYIPIMIEDLHKIDQGLLFMSHLQRKRLQMLYREVMN